MPPSASGERTILATGGGVSKDPGLAKEKVGLATGDWVLLNLVRSLALK